MKIKKGLFFAEKKKYIFSSSQIYPVKFVTRATLFLSLSPNIRYASWIPKYLILLGCAAFTSQANFDFFALTRFPEGLENGNRIYIHRVHLRICLSVRWEMLLSVNSTLHLESNATPSRKGKEDCGYILYRVRLFILSRTILKHAKPFFNVVLTLTARNGS